MRTRFLVRKIYLNSSIDTVFDFFSKPENLNELTPSKLHFQILSPMPIIMKVGTLIDYRIKLFGIAFNWKTKITHYNPQEQFIDTQIKGPYLKWIHAHSFEVQGNGVLMRDTVEYSCPGGFLEPLIHSLVIKRNLNDIFEYRNKKCREIFG